MMPLAAENMDLFKKKREQEKTLSENRKRDFSGDKGSHPGLNAVVRIMRDEIKELQFTVSLLKRDMGRIERNQYKQPAAKEISSQKELEALLANYTAPGGNHLPGQMPAYGIGEETL